MLVIGVSLNNDRHPLNVVFKKPVEEPSIEEAIVRWSCGRYLLRRMDFPVM
jgi:hypothetical protein